MNRVTVSSSNLRAIGYNQETATLEVEFLDGSVYSYAGVPSSIHAGIMAASSHGSYLDTYVKKGGYKFTKIR